jgi:hypothetical protein
MTGTAREPTVRDRLSERPAAKPARLKQVRPRDIGIRFVAGSLTSIAAGLVAIGFGPRVGGVLLAFPAILAASLTLIEEQEDSVDAREDARGAIVGGAALTAFAVVGELTLSHIPGGLALAAATVAWVAVGGALYALLWWR